jgi:pimeloyl-ACP methyl ester carboxylesterase
MILHMSFDELGRLADQQPDFRALKEKVDKRLSMFAASGIARTAEFASFFDVDEYVIVGIFSDYVTMGVLQRLRVVECAGCGGVFNLMDLKVHSPMDSFCPICGITIARVDASMGYKVTQGALQMTTNSRATGQQGTTHIILLIHGIRTQGVWQELVAEELNVIPGIKALPIGYEFMDAIKFWFPLWTRDASIQKVLGKIRHAMSLHRQADVSVIAHSFGTYAIFRLMQREADLRFKRIILCGSVVSHDAPWAYVQPRIQEEIINDCGTRDIWPVAARAFSWGYGATGTFGFKSPGVYDRFHDMGHGGFFNKEFIEKYWVPFMSEGVKVPSRWTTTRPPSSWPLLLLSSSLFRFVLILIIVLCIWKTSVWLTGSSAIKWLLMKVIAAS